jgi:hypothetical protein
VGAVNREQRRRGAQAARRAHRDAHGTEAEHVGCIPAGVNDGRAKLVARVEAGGCLYRDADIAFDKSPDGGLIVSVAHDPGCPRLDAFRARN